MTQPRVYADPPPPGPIEQSLTGQDGPTRLRLKARALWNSLQNASYPVTYSLDGYRILVTQPPELFTWTKVDPDTGQTATKYGISFPGVQARIIGGGLLPVDPPYRFVNPPIKVPNGTWRTITESGEMFDVPNMEERPLDALKRILLDAVLAYARQRGAIP